MKIVACGSNPHAKKIHILTPRRMNAEGNNPSILWKSMNNVLRRGKMFSLPAAPVT